MLLGGDPLLAVFKSFKVAIDTAQGAVRVLQHDREVGFAISSLGLTEALPHQLWSLLPKLSTTEVLGESQRSCDFEYGDGICLNMSARISYASGKLFLHRLLFKITDRDFRPKELYFLI